MVMCRLHRAVAYSLTYVENISDQYAHKTADAF